MAAGSSEINVLTERRGPVFVVTINRPDARNAVDGPTAAALVEAFRAFDADASLSVAVLTGADGNFCAGADLKAMGTGRGNRVDVAGDGPMGPSRLVLSKPVIAAIEGFAVAGGLELAVWCDMRVAARSAVFGVFCRRWGVPLIDGGTVRLPRIVGHGRAMDLILTGRQVEAEECLAIGLANRLCADGSALESALELANQLTRFPQSCMRADRLSAIEQWSLDVPKALGREWKSADTFRSEGSAGAARFASGKGRSGDFSEI